MYSTMFDFVFLLMSLNALSDFSPWQPEVAQ